MAYLAQQLINDSWQLSGIIGAQLQTADGYQGTQGLFLLNALLNYMQIQNDYIPYYTYNETITCVPEQEKYFVEGAAAITSVTFTFSQVRYSMQKLSPIKYFASNRVNTIYTLPFNYTFYRVEGGSDLYLYPIPDQGYALQVLGKFFLSNVSLDTDLALTLDTGYIEYLRWALADYMCMQMGVSLTADKKQTYMSLKRKLMDMTPPDMSVMKTSVLGNAGAPFDLQSVGIYAGFVPS